MARAEIGRYIHFYNTERPHQALEYRTPAQLYYAEAVAVVKERVLESEISRVPILNRVRIAV